MDMKTINEKAKLEIDRIKRILNNKNAVMKLGMILVIAGFMIGWISGYMNKYSPIVADTILQTATIFLYAGVLIIGYYILRFVDMKKKTDSQSKDTTEEIVAEIENTINEKQTA